MIQMPRRSKRKVILPNEIYLEIFKYIEIEQRFKFRKVSKQFRLLIDLLNPYKYIDNLITIPTNRWMNHSYPCPNNRYIHNQSINHSIHSIICRPDKLIIDNGYFYNIDYNELMYDRYLITKRVKTLYLETGDQIKLKCRDQVKKCYIDDLNIQDIILRVDLDGSRIIVSRRLIFIILNTQLYIGQRLIGKSTNSTFYEFGQWKDGIRSVACDSNSNIYVFNCFCRIQKYHYRGQLISEIQLNDYGLHTMIIDSKNRLFVCNTNTIYVHDLNGILLFKINKEFTDLRCMALDSNGNLVVVDDRTIHRIYL